MEKKDLLTGVALVTEAVVMAPPFFREAISLIGSMESYGLDPTVKMRMLTEMLGPDILVGAAVVLGTFLLMEVAPTLVKAFLIPKEKKVETPSTGESWTHDASENPEDTLGRPMGVSHAPGATEARNWTYGPSSEEEFAAKVAAAEARKKK